MSAKHAWHARWAVKRDMPEILDIDESSFERPWPEDEFLQILSPRNCIAMVAENPEGRIVGYMVYRLHRHHVVLLKMAVAPDHRREGIGTVLIDALRAKLSGVRNRLYVDVPETSLDFQLLLRSCGIPCVNLVRGRNGCRDTLHFEDRLVETGVTQ